MEYQLSAMMEKNPKGLVPCPRLAIDPLIGYYAPGT